MKRIWGIRHIRYAWMKYKLLRWFSNYSGPGWHINDADWEYLDSVWRGER
jgi:hypothetical protein